LLPKVSLDEIYFHDLCHPWKDALVVKLLGKNIGYNVLKDQLTKMWKLQGQFEIMDIDQGFYIVRCEMPSDREKIVTEGPWIVFSHYLAVSQWSPEFAGPEAKIEKTLVFVHFLGLNLLYYDESFLLALASTVGTPIRVDKNTLKFKRGKFTRICVEIDLTKLVIDKVWVNDHWYKVQY